MKKILIFLFAAISLQMPAQIQRNILGMTLGKSSKAEVVNMFKAKKQAVKKKDDDTYSIKNVKFAGNNWTCLYLEFYNNKLFCITFFDGYPEKTITSLDYLWKRINNTLARKYSQYVDNSCTDNSLYFEDGTTDLWLNYSSDDGGRTLSLSYCDRKIGILRAHKNADDL